MEKKDSYFLVRINFILSLMIVWHHAYNVDVYDLANSESKIGNFFGILEGFLSITQLVAVPAFFMISGYLFFRNYSWNKVIEKYKKRFFSLVLPYLSWNTLVYLYYFTLTHIPAIAGRMSMEEVEISANGIYRNIVFSDLNYAMWFIRALIILVIVSPLFFMLLKRNKLCAWVTYLFSLFIYIAFPIGQHTALFAASFYILGAVIGIYYPRIPFQNRSRLFLACSLVAFVLMNIICIRFNLFDYQRIRAILLIVDVTLFWELCHSIAALNSNKEMPWYYHISFFVFCMHGIVLESIEKILYILLGKNTIGAIVDYIFAPVITIGIILIAAYILKKWCKPVWTILSGGRN